MKIELVNGEPKLVVTLEERSQMYEVACMLRFGGMKTPKLTDAAEIIDSFLTVYTNDLEAELNELADSQS